MLQTDSGNINAETSFLGECERTALSAFNSIDLRSGVVIANTGGGSVTLRADNTGIGRISGAGLKTGFGQVKFGAGAQIALSGGTTPGDVSILYDGYNSPRALSAPRRITPATWTRRRHAHYL